MEYIYCPQCKKLLVVIDASKCPTLCCGKAMIKLVANTHDGAKEKHVPLIVENDNGYTVKIGEVPHPMTTEHYIELVELDVDNITHFIRLSPNDPPEASFVLPKGSSVKATIFCNLHLLWSSK